MVTCNTCDDTLGTIGFQCSYCNGIQCKQHRSPDDHACPSLENGSSEDGDSNYEVRNTKEIKRDRRQEESQTQKENGREEKSKTESENAVKYSGEGEVDSRWWYAHATAVTGLLVAWAATILAVFVPNRISELAFHIAVGLALLAGLAGLVSIILCVEPLF